MIWNRVYKEWSKSVVLRIIIKGKDIKLENNIIIHCKEFLHKKRKEIITRIRSVDLEILCKYVRSNILIIENIIIKKSILLIFSFKLFITKGMKERNKNLQ